MTAASLRFGATRSASRRVADALRNGLLALLLLPALAVAQLPAALPYQVEAVFLFNFTQFVSWPVEPSASVNEPFALCILGEDPFGKYLDEVVAGETAQGRPLQVLRLNSAEDATRCQIVFVGKSESARVGELLARLAGHATLTVSDMEDFGRRGGMVRFVVENRRVRLRINVEAARSAGLTFSSNLLRIAEIVGKERP